MALSTKAKVNLTIATVSFAAVAILVAQNLTAVEVDVFYLTVETNLAALIPTIFTLGCIVGWATHSFAVRKRAKKDTTPEG